MFPSLFSLHLLEITTTHAGFSISVLLFGAFVTMDMSMGIGGSRIFETVFFPSNLLPRPPTLDSHSRFCLDLRYLLIGRGLSCLAAYSSCT